MKHSLALLCLLSAPSFAAPPETSPVPVLRGQAVGSDVAQPVRPRARALAASAAPVAALVAQSAPAIETAPHAQKPRPLARPEALEQALLEQLERSHRFGAALAPTSDDLAANTPGVEVLSLAVRSLRPSTRPPAIVQKAMARKREETAGRLGGLQGVQGERVGRVEGRGRCGIDNALRVTQVAGVRLSTPALLDQATARALKQWVENGLKPAVGSMGGGVAQMRVVAHYACRTRNNQAGARLSEHSFGRAIDLAGFTLRNGDTINLLRDWGGGSKGRALRAMHRSACGPFGTVLGPEANRFHRDHFHFDTARYRSGSYCR